jgi:hypothetical protein
MLEIGMHGASLVLTVLLIAALKKGGQSIPAAGGLVGGAVLAYVYARAGEPWAILHAQAARLRDNLGDEVGASAAAVALAIFAWWWYAAPKARSSALLGFLLMVSAESAGGLWQRVVSIVGSLVRVVTG